MSGINHWLNYAKHNRGVDENCPDGGVKCIHYNYCGSVLPDDWVEYKGKYLCVTCDISLWGTYRHRKYRRNNKCLE